jgi:ubiquinone/menaquinone biosynthesis C-methylase UbiE
MSVVWVHDRAPAGDALRQVRAAAFPPGEFVGQESFVTSGEVLTLARRARIGPGVRVLDLCCGMAGPGLLVTRELGCAYVGLDASAAALDAARLRARAAGLVADFRMATIPPVPVGRFDVVLLLETLLAFHDKPALLREVATVLPVGGRFACTVKEGRPLTTAERAAMPGSDTVWLTPLARLRTDLNRAGLRVRWCVETSRTHRATVDALVDAYTAAAQDLVGLVGADTVDRLVTSHRLWSRWLRDGRVRKFAVVAEKVRP